MKTLEAFRLTRLVLALTTAASGSAWAEDWVEIVLPSAGPRYFVDVMSINVTGDVALFNAKAMHAFPRWDPSDRLYDLELIELKANCSSLTRTLIHVARLKGPSRLVAEDTPRFPRSWRVVPNTPGEMQFKVVCDIVKTRSLHPFP